MRRREFVKLIASAASAAALPGCAARAPVVDSAEAAPRVLLLAFDGLDPRLLQTLMEAGRLPNFKRLAELGGSQSIGTTTPPHTPVAFSTVITGTDPGAHGVFDFIHRDPAPVGTSLPVRPFLSTAEAIPLDDAWRISLGGWEMPLEASQMRLMRRGKPFWEHLVAAGIDTDVYFFPANFPCSTVTGPGRFRAISGMGVPDLSGSHGDFAFYSTALKEPLRLVSGGRFVKLTLTQHRAETELWGPVDRLSAATNGSANGQSAAARMRAKLSIQRDPVAKMLLLELGKERILLHAGEWSDWLPVEFVSGLPGAGIWASMGSPTAVKGMVRVYVRSVHPALEVYVSPVNLDPLDPALPISEPADFARELATRHGRFSTLGIPEDTKAFTHGALHAEAFAGQVAQASTERLRLWHGALADFHAGCLCFYFGASDLMQHMFWRDHDSDHPAHNADEAKEHGQLVPAQYEQADLRVGEALAILHTHDTLLVFSDHGFTSFRQGFNLNQWLTEQGHLRLVQPGVRQTEENSKASEGSMFPGVDWGYSQAYGLGMNGLYLNLQGREKFGRVKLAEKKALCKQLCEELLRVKDSSGKFVLDRVEITSEYYPASDERLAPDLILGYADGFRASWETVLGGISQPILTPNLEQWSGEHLISARLVPGVLFTNRKLNSQAPHLRDLAPTVLRLFGLDSPEAMAGHTLIES